MARKSLKNATLKILDGTTPVPLEVTVLLGTGNVTWTENYGYDYEPERGVIADGTVRDADEQPVEVNVTATWENTYYDANDSTSDSVTPYEALKNVGAAATGGWETTGADACEPYACRLRIEFDVTCGTVADELVVFDEFRCESCAFDISAGTLVFSGKSKQVSPTVTRTTFT